MLDFYFKDVDGGINYGHTQSEQPVYFDFHLHNWFEIYFFISGNVNYFIEKTVYPLKYGDLLIINSHEIHRPTFQPGTGYERIVIHFDPAVARLMSSPGFDLLACFVNKPAGEKNKISLSKRQLDELLLLFKKFEDLESGSSSGTEILRLSYLMEVLVFINRAFCNTVPAEAELPNIPEKLVPILEYIDLHLEGDLSLEVLEHSFYVSKFHLSRLFKKLTGSGIHEYILYKRISRAKQLLSEGCSVTEACIKSGFNDYSNFLRMFKRTVGVSPGQYRKSHNPA